MDLNIKSFKPFTVKGDEMIYQCNNCDSTVGEYEFSFLDFINNHVCKKNERK